MDAISRALLASEGKTNCITGSNTLNPACFDKVAVALLNAYVALPKNTAGGFLNYLNQGSLTTNETDYQHRVDYYITQNYGLTGRFMYQRSNTAYPYDTWGGLPYDTIADSQPFSGFNGLVRLQATITPSLLNTFAVADTDDKLQYINTKGGTLPD